MSDENLDTLGERLDDALKRLRETARQYTVGTKILFNGKFGVVTDLNKDSKDPAGSTVDIKLEDGSVVEKVSVTTKALEFYHA